MPQQTDTNRLWDSIRSYGAGAPEPDCTGRLMFSRDGDDHLAKACHEIMHTRLGRRVTFYAADEVCLELSVRNGRLFALRMRPDSNPPIDCAGATTHDVGKVLAAMQRAFPNCASLTVGYDRLPDEIEQEGPGVCPQSILALRQMAAAVPDEGPGDTNDGMAEIHLEGSALKSANGPDAGIAQLTRVIATRPPQMQSWIETLNDDLIEEIALCTGSGQKVRLNYSATGVRMVLL